MLDVDTAGLHAFVLDGLHVLDACDTAAVREGLLDDALLAKFAGVRGRLAIALATPDEASALVALTEPTTTRAQLADRLRALRAGRQRAGEPAAAVDDAIAALTDADFAELAPALATCQLWYCEWATSGLSAAALVRVIAAAVGAARAAGIDSVRRGTRSCGRSSPGCTATARRCAIDCDSSRPRSRRGRSRSCSRAPAASARSAR